VSTRRTALLAILKLADLATVTTCLALTIALSSGPSGFSWTDILEMRVSLGNFLFIGVYLAFWHFVLRMHRLYDSYRLSPAARELKDLGLAVGIATAPLIPVSLVFGFESVNLAFLVIFPTMTFAALGTERRALRAVARRLRSVGRNLREVVIVGDAGPALDVAAKLAQREGLGYRVAEMVTVDDAAGASGDGASSDTALARVADLLERRPIDEVFVALPLDGARPLLRPLIALCEEQGVFVRVMAHIAALDWGKARIDTFDSQPVITISSAPPESLSLILKRLIDIAGACFGLVLLAPLFLAIAIAVKLDSPGPVFFVQERVGQNRRRFHAYKFRTMVAGAEQMQEDLEDLNEAEGPIFKIEHDPRRTRLGRWLRRSSLDELPQLVNVLLGDMSLVGPRPLPVRDVSRIDVRWHKRRFSVKPGITCLWQVESRAPKFDDWIRADMEYIDNWSLVLDLKILARTLPAVISGQSAH
jgi:exopolysaccharide biosynthesis polyprenyl glycosylphosphotransferase